jgi:hypothetical protein
MSRPVVGCLCLVAGLICTSLAFAQQRGWVSEPAPIFLLPDASRVPLHRATAGMPLAVIGTDGQWLNVSWDDPQFGRRTGYIQSRFVTRFTAPTTPPAAAPIASPAPELPAAAPSPAASRPETPAAAPGRPVSTPLAVTSLAQVRRIFIEPMENDLHQYISAEIVKELQGRIALVLTKDSADAIMRGVSENRTGVGAAITGRYFGLHDNASGTVTLVDRGETMVLWVSEAGDRSPMWGIMARGGHRKVADRLVNNLKKALNTAK